MISDSKIKLIQDKIKAAVLKIENEENIKIEFGSCRYNSAYYNTTMKVTTLDKTEKVSGVFEGISKRFGFTQNIMGMKFDGKNGLYEIVDIKTRSRKYPIIAKSLTTGQSFKYTVDQIKRYMGGDKIINRNSNLDKLIGD